jgi:hypothetical protein
MITQKHIDALKAVLDIHEAMIGEECPRSLERIGACVHDYPDDLQELHDNLLTGEEEVRKLDVTLESLNAADEVNGKIIRLCCSLYTMARNAGVDPELPVMKMAEEQLRHHSFWDEEQWGEGKS